MKKKLRLLSFVFVLLMLPFSGVNAKQFDVKLVKEISIAGIVVDAKTLKPLDNANVYDDGNRLVAKTDQKGYFVWKLDFADQRKLFFKFKIEKDGYVSFVQTENGGDVKPTNTVYYFGLNQNGQADANTSFSEMMSNKNDVAYETIVAGLKDIKEKKDFNNKLKNALKGNENSFVEIDKAYYLCNNGGWIKLNSKEDKVSIDGKDGVVASELNKLVKRKDIKRMTPIESPDLFEIYTK